MGKPPKAKKTTPSVVVPEVVIEDEEIIGDDREPEVGEAEEGDEDEGYSSDENLPVPAQGTLQVWDPTHTEHETDLVPVSPTDPLKRYFEEVSRYNLLTPEEEYTLAVRLKEKGDLDAAKALVTANLRLVVKIAMEYRSMYTNIMDLIQEGNVGLMKAVSKFDPTQGAKLSYYASWWIRSYILKYLLDNFRLVRVGTTAAQKKLFFHLMREKERLEAQGLVAGPKLLADKLQVREKDVIEMEQRLSGRGAEMSLDQPLGSGDEERRGSLLELLSDPSEGADERLAREELLRKIENLIPTLRKQLNPKERQILDERLLSEVPKTLQEIASKYNLTRERARQIEGKVIERLRGLLEAETQPSAPSKTAAGRRAKGSLQKPTRSAKRIQTKTVKKTR